MDVTHLQIEIRIYSKVIKVTSKYFFETVVGPEQIERAGYGVKDG